MGYKNFIARAKRILQEQLDETLTYHGYHHAEDVLKCVSAATKRNKFGHHKTQLLKIAAFTHDIGYIDTYKGHETRGVEIISPILEEEGYTVEDIELISKWILATNPDKKAKTLEEKIMKDADLDYLGRADFYDVAKTLFEEWVSKGIIASDFNLFEKQELHFLLDHKYLTEYARTYREPEKRKRIKELKQKLKI